MKVIKKALKIVGIGFAALIVLVIAIGIFGGGSDSPRETSKQQTERQVGRLTMLLWFRQDIWGSLRMLR